MKTHEQFTEELYHRRDKKLRAANRRKRVLTACVSLVLVAVMVFSFFSYPENEQIKVHATDLMTATQEAAPEGMAPDDAFIRSQMDFSLKLFRECQTGENSLISPLSVSLALAMAANGAEGDTLADIEAVLGGLPIEDLNQYLCYYVNHLTNTEQAELSIANSIWFKNKKEDFIPNTSFLQTVRSYYDADAYAAPFDKTTLGDINDWISSNTDGKIQDALDYIDPAAFMYLINTILFDGEWETPYRESRILEDTFTSASGKEQTVSMMRSTESCYLENENAAGFIKDYAEGYRFVALLPDEGMTVEEYINTLTPDSLLDMLENAQERTVRAGLPKFQYESSYELKDALTALGMGSAFQRDAEFDRTGTTGTGIQYISRVIHKTHITVDGTGTEAAATTIVEYVYGTAATAPAEIAEVILDRPFVYLIIDAETNLPIFMGTVTDLG